MQANCDPQGTAKFEAPSTTASPAPQVVLDTISRGGTKDTSEGTGREDSNQDTWLLVGVLAAAVVLILIVGAACWSAFLSAWNKKVDAGDVINVRGDLRVVQARARPDEPDIETPKSQPQPDGLSSTPNIRYFDGPRGAAAESLWQEKVQQVRSGNITDGLPSPARASVVRVS